MQGIYTYIPETNNVPKEYNAAAILSLLFMVPISLVPALTLMYFYISTFRSMCAVPNMAVLLLLLLLLLLLSATVLSHGGSGYFICIQIYWFATNLSREGYMRSI
jgi:hypothetical protein